MEEHQLRISLKFDTVEHYSDFYSPVRIRFVLNLLTCVSNPSVVLHVYIHTQIGRSIV